MKLDAMEVRVDYMGTSVLMGRVSHLNVSLANEWQVPSATPAESGSSGSTSNRSMVYIFGDLKWDQLQLMISKSTNADLLKIYYKLEEFFVQQFKSSKRVFSILEPWPGANNRNDTCISFYSSLIEILVKLYIPYLIFFFGGGGIQRYLPRCDSD